jgi:NADPH-dependent curcumin reductase CurA
MSSACIARVIASDHTDYPVGSLIQARLPLQEYSSISPAHLSSIAPPRLLDNPHGLTDLRLFLGPLGMPELTAFSSFYEICQPKPGEMIFISAASGAAGSLVGQLAKREGMVVIGSVGSNDKVRYIVDELGFDWGFNYKTEDPAEALTRLAPEGLDVYYDNVGGKQLEVAIDAMKNAGGRIAVCGMVSQYNVPDGQKYGVKNLFQLVAKGIKMQGFKQQDKDFGPKWREEYQDKVGRWLSDGAIKAAIHESVGVRSAAGAFVDMLEGRNFGKTVVKIHKGDDNMVVWKTGVYEGEC